MRIYVLMVHDNTVDFARPEAHSAYKREDQARLAALDMFEMKHDEDGYWFKSIDDFETGAWNWVADGMIEWSCWIVQVELY